jgi:flagellar operon protein
MNRINPRISNPTQTPARATRPLRQGEFKSILDEKLSGPVRFSKHAEERLQSRSITLSNGELAELSTAVDRAAQKGIRDSLILMNDLALIVHVPNRVVVTALSGQAAKENIYTNIDGAVIL